LKLEAKEPSMEEAKGCELKLPFEIKKTARIRCGGRVSTGAIASRNPVEGEKVPTPVRRSAHIQGMKRKDYKEVSPEPKDYGVATTSTIVARARGRPPEETITTSTFGMRCPRRRLPKALTAAATTMVVATTVETMAMMTPSDFIRCVVEFAVNPSGISTRRSTNVSKPWKR
jgi:hypothetical protein